MGVSERGVEDREPAGAGETVEHPGRLNEGILRPLSPSRSMALMGVGSWEPLDPANHGTVC